MEVFVLLRREREDVLVCSGCHNWILRTGYLKHQNLFSYNSGAWKSKIKVPTGMVSDEASLKMSTFSLCSYRAFGVWGEEKGWGKGRELRLIILSLLKRDPSPTGWGLHSWLHLTFITFLKALSPSTVGWWLEWQHINGEGEIHFNS